MHKLTELETVEEEKDLVPNIPVLAKALFGDNAYLTPKAPSQADWATEKTKFGDGLLWLPWRRQLWLIEVEWKAASNFFQQSRAFAGGKVDKEKLSVQLREVLEQFSEVLNRSSSELREGVIIKNIINETLKNHVIGDRFRPHLWVILGHSGNREKLKRDYEEELQDRFGRGDKHYILSMARMFLGDFSSYILLEQSCSKGCSDLIEVPSSLLISAVHRTFRTETPVPEDKAEEVKISQPPSEGRAARIWAHLKETHPELIRNHVKLRVQIDEKHYYDFPIDWDHPGDTFMVKSKHGMSRRQGTAAAEVFGSLLPKGYGNVARKFGVLFDFSQDPPRRIAPYKDIEPYRWEKGQPDAASVSRPSEEKAETFFQRLDAHKQKRILDNILNRRRLWKTFLERKRMSVPDFKEFSDFRPKAIAGFLLFLTRNGIASRFGDIFTLNEAVIPEIQRLLNRSEL